MTRRFRLVNSRVHEWRGHTGWNWKDLELFPLYMYWQHFCKIKSWIFSYTFSSQCRGLRLDIIKLSMKLSGNLAMRISTAFILALDVKAWLNLCVLFFRKAKYPEFSISRRVSIQCLARNLGIWQGWWLFNACLE